MQWLAGNRKLEKVLDSQPICSRCGRVSISFHIGFLNNSSVLYFLDEKPVTALDWTVLYSSTACRLNSCWLCIWLLYTLLNKVYSPSFEWTLQMILCFSSLNWRKKLYCASQLCTKQSELCFYSMHRNKMTFVSLHCTAQIVLCFSPLDWHTFVKVPQSNWNRLDSESVSPENSETINFHL